ncbi:MAG: aldehyde ferredoxin oxidoreductase N-terminal domain-containing protein [Dehalococcoidales bacterium]|nr:aldehyde ferredoxin oxidoreductase N-terminal domain-containing protein [Dehalococcoidales bacterium]
MRYGIMGTDIEVNLSRGSIEKVQTDLALVEDFLGGKGKNVKILWDRVPAGVDAFSPDNLLIISAGALVGTMAPAANRTTITFKSPIIDTHCYSILGGYFAAELKFAGYDSLVFSGKSPTPVYLLIDNDRVELRDASHLWGKDTHETESILREELKDDRIEIMCVGPAGENRVYTASIQHGVGASASRGGAGAVMGDKKLKAIAVRGTKDVNVANPARLSELCQSIRDRTGPVGTHLFDRFGYSRIQRYARGVDYGYGNKPLPPELQHSLKRMGDTAQNFINRKADRRVDCYNCGLRCIHAYPLPDGDYAYIKCSNLVQALRCTRILDLDFGVTFYYWCERYGLDAKAITSQIHLAVKLYENGILTREDTGMHLEWENPEVALSLMKQIAHRQGIGDVLADGVYRAAQRIGRGAEDFVRHIKKLELVPSGRDGERGAGALSSAIADKGDSSKLIGSTPDNLWERAWEGTHVPNLEDKEAYLNSEYFQFPGEFKKYISIEEEPADDDYEGICQFIAYNEETFTLSDATGICNYLIGHHGSPPISGRPLIAGLISAATGLDIDEAEATRIARRIINLVKACKVRDGLSRKDDSLTDRRTQKASGGDKPARSLLDRCIDRYYELRGWDNDGIPTSETLVKLGLDDVRQELEQRGFIKALAAAE